jgi:hypothetical protein
VYVLSVLQLPLDTLVFMLNRFTADDFSNEGIPAGGVQFSPWVLAKSNRTSIQLHMPASVSAPCAVAAGSKPYPAFQAHCSASQLGSVALLACS